MTEEQFLTIEQIQTMINPEGSRDLEFLFIKDCTVVGQHSADCAVCAWRSYSHLYPGARMACWTGNILATDICIHERNREIRRRQINN